MTVYTEDTPARILAQGVRTWPEVAVAVEFDLHALCHIHHFEMVTNSRPHCANCNQTWPCSNAPRTVAPEDTDD